VFIQEILIAEQDFTGCMTESEKRGKYYEDQKENSVGGRDGFIIGRAGMQCLWREGVFIRQSGRKSE